MRIQADFSNGTTIYSDLLQFGNDPLVIRSEDGGMIEIKQCLSFPGLVNSHDHLEFNLFPLLINRQYPDYQSWGADIHQHHKQVIDRMQAVPLHLRIKWGILKNLMNGFTNIVHHGTEHDMIRQIPYPVFLNYRFIHSPGTEPWWRMKLNLPDFKDVMIHLGEGTHKKSAQEIRSVLNWNLLSKALIAIHAIQMTSEQSAKFKAVVWCPESNMNLYGITAPVDRLKSHTRILFGTDSTVSASANHWQHLRHARSSGLMTEEEIFNALTKTAGDVFGIRKTNSFVVTDRTGDGWNGFFSTDPEDVMLVSINNEIQLIDATIKTMNPDVYELIEIDRKRKWIRRSLGDVVRAIEISGTQFPLDVKAL